jgi:hypothetical protein
VARHGQRGRVRADFLGGVDQRVEDVGTVREYGRVHSAFWASTDIQALSDDGKLLALYLLSCSHGTIAGVCRLPDGYVSEDLKWAATRVAKGFVELFEKGFANRCERTKWVWVRKFLQWNPPENPNQWKAVWKAISQIPTQCSWLADFVGFISRITGKELPPEANPCETVSELFRNPISTTTQQEQEHQRVPTEPVERSAPDSSEVKREAIEKVFDHWRDVHGHPQAKLDDKRRRVIRSALAKYSEADLCMAISGYRNSPHHMGQNERSTVYDDIELLLRDAKHIDAGIRFYSTGPPGKLSSLTRRNVDATADWVPPEMRNAAV